MSCHFEPLKSRFSCKFGWNNDAFCDEVQQHFVCFLFLLLIYLFIFFCYKRKLGVFHCDISMNGIHMMLMSSFSQFFICSSTQISQLTFKQSFHSQWKGKLLFQEWVHSNGLKLLKVTQSRWVVVPQQQPLRVLCGHTRTIPSHLMTIKLLWMTM